jgi:hypothetical protein
MHCLLQNTSCRHWRSIQLILIFRFLSLIFKSQLGDHWNHAIIFCAVVDSVLFFFSVFLSRRIKVLVVDDTRFMVIYTFFSLHLVIVIHPLQGRKLYFSNDASRKITNAWNINSPSEFLQSKFDKNTTGIRGVI